MEPAGAPQPCPDCRPDGSFLPGDLLGTLRYLGTFLDDPEDTPDVVVDYVAEQLGLSPAAFVGYGTAEHRWDHQEQIREAYGYTKFDFDQ